MLTFGHLTLGEKRTLCKRFVEPSLWLQDQYHKHDDLLVMVKRVHGLKCDLLAIILRALYVFVSHNLIICIWNLILHKF